MIRLRFAACVLLGLFIAPVSASAQPSFSTTVSPNVATYPDTTELTYRVQITTGDDPERVDLTASNGSGLRLGSVTLEGPGTITNGAYVAQPANGACEIWNFDWSQEYSLDLPPESISTLVLVMRTGPTRADTSPHEYWFALSGAGDMPRVPVSRADVRVSYCGNLHLDPADPNPPVQPQPVQHQLIPLGPNPAPSPVVQNSVNVLRGYARVHLRCVLDCKGTVRIKRYGKLLGQRGFHAAAGTNAVLWIPIKRQGRRMLSRNKRLAADVAIQLPTGTHRTAITLRDLDR